MLLTEYSKAVCGCLTVFAVTVFAKGDISTSDNACHENVSLSCEADDSIALPSFAVASDWNIVNGEDKLKIEAGRDFLGHHCLFIGGADKKCDTWFSVVSKPITVQPSAEYLVTMNVYSEKPITTTTYALRDVIECKWANAVLWYDAEGRQISSGAFAFYMPGGKRFEKISVRIKSPADASKVAIKIAFDRPNIAPGKAVAFSDFTMVRLDGRKRLRIKEGKEDMDLARRHFLASRPPYVQIVSETPTANRSTRLELQISDELGVDCDTVRISIDGTDSTSMFSRKGDRWRMNSLPLGGWTEGLHEVVVDVADKQGNAVKSRKAFFIGEAARDVPKCSLREDGMAIVDGKPFFPIGVYAVCKREFNGYDFDRAFKDLADAGFNFAHTYSKESARSEEFITAAERHGLKLWHGCRFPDEWFINRGRFCKSILAWYLGDDTCEHITPEDERDYNDAVKAIDPCRLTCQADNLTPDCWISQYSPYVTSTDVFMPEIYPVRGKKGDPSDGYCVAMTIRMMEQARRDIERFGDGKPRAVWPILQWFKGWYDWHHFPSRDQLFATSFAALIHGANGILWYTYGGFFNKKKNRSDEGVTSSPERWRDISDLATFIKELSPMLLDGKGNQLSAEVISGSPVDPFGGASVTALQKHHNGCVYVLAVNAAPEPVRARFRIKDVDAEGEVLKENRKVSAKGGVFEDDFNAFGVHVYRFCSANK